MKHLTVIIRVILTILIIIGVYSETGIYTAIAITLITLSLEASNFTLNKIFTRMSR
jgi:hypothetical protein